VERGAYKGVFVSRRERAFLEQKKTILKKNEGLLYLDLGFPHVTAIVTGGLLYLNNSYIK